MEKDLITKIKTTAAKKEHIDEEGIRSLMILIRKLLDKMPQSDQNLYLTIRLFCNWVAHIKITQSNTGLRILAEINDALVSIKNSTDMIAMRTKMSQAIGFSDLRKELKSFFGHIGVDDILVSDNNIWAVFIDNLIEIIRDVPLSFPQLSKLDATKQNIYKKIAQNPIKPGAGVISIQISRVDYAALGAQEVGDIMCLLIRTEDTTTTVIPLLIDVRL
jgi:hypothetical protein